MTNFCWISLTVLAQSTHDAITFLLLSNIELVIFESSFFFFLNVFVYFSSTFLLGTVYSSNCHSPKIKGLLKCTHYILKKTPHNNMVCYYLIMKNMHLYIQENTGSNNITVMFHKLFFLTRSKEGKKVWCLVMSVKLKKKQPTNTI